MQADGSNISICPTFNPRSNGNLSEIGAKVAQDNCRGGGGGESISRTAADGGADSDFAFATRTSYPSSPIPADEIFQNGKIRPLCLVDPNRNRVTNNVVVNRDSPLPIPVGIRNNCSDPPGGAPTPTPKSRNPLRKLFGEERRIPPRKTSSDETKDDLLGLPKDSSCPPRPVADEEEARPKKSAFSTVAGNFQKRLKFIGLLNRTIPGRGLRGNFVFLTHSHSERKENEKKSKETPPISRKSRSAAWDGGEKQQQ